MSPDPPNSLICCVFLARTAAGPLQCEPLELPVAARMCRNVHTKLHKGTQNVQRYTKLYYINNVKNFGQKNVCMNIGCAAQPRH